MVEMNAIYIHGLGSGAVTSAVKTISKILPQYKWHPLEINENLKESVAVIDAEVNELMPQSVVSLFSVSPLLKNQLYNLHYVNVLLWKCLLP